MENKNQVILYHGSHGGISGVINASSSRKLCDFGIGFYTGDKQEQAKSIIADDEEGVFYTLKADLDGIITDKALSECLKSVKLGSQYVFKNDMACQRICIIKSGVLQEDEKKELKHQKNIVIGSISSIVEDLQRRYRREGLYIDEILEKYR